MNFNDWINYFKRNQNHFSEIGWDYFSPLSSQEKKLIFSSLQQFQRGEHSEGHNLIRFASELGDPSYVETIKLFIKEEQMHALVLGRFMDQENIPKIRMHWVDSLFRKIRRLAGLELSIIVLTTAELIAAVFYKALYFATHSAVLRELCEQILRDEEMHINFQAFTFRNIYSKKGRIYRMCSRLLNELVVRCAILLVYFDHRKVLKAGQYNFIRFHDEVMQEFFRLENMISGEVEIEIREGEEVSDFNDLFVLR